MALKRYYSSDVQAAARNLRAKDRDFVMGIGAEGYAELDNLIRRPQGISESTSKPIGAISAVCTGTPRKPKSTTERLNTPMTPSRQEDDSGSEVIIVSSSVIPKRKLSITSTPGPLNKRAKTARAFSDEPQLPDSEIEEDSGEDESEYDYDKNKDAIDPEHKQKTAKASKEFNSACRNCKSNANKALKATYELQISKLKSEHKQELREVKAKKAEILTETKVKANTEKATAKTRYEKLIKDLKAHRDGKIADLEEKHKEAAEEWQEKSDDFKKKIKKLTAQRDEADAKRKDIERSAADGIKASKEDLKAGERKLKEEKKQMLREKQEAIDILKPQHSQALKEKERFLKDMTDKVISLEKTVQSRDHALQRLQANHDTLLQQFKNLKIEHAENQKHSKQLEKDLHDFKKYAAGVDGRADSKLARAYERIELQETNVREHSNRVITITRENHKLRDNLATVARLGREKRDEVERLKAELQSTKAELGVVKDMEEMSGEF